MAGGIYGSSILGSVTEGVDMRSVVEKLAYDDISRGTDTQIQEFCKSPEAQALLEKGVFKKPTLMRLGQADDLKRRKKLTAYELAKQANDPLWTKLVKNREKEKELISKIMQKYGNKADKVAKIGQKEYIKQARSAK
ncbi:MAG: hypothetical protein NC548_15495 [Lachnospiraceae bacterium]|nr:hypothetical protein [Lachnospiraceae bacterium]